MNILLHMCCGPCACYPVPKLRSEGHDITGYFFNPNMHRLTTAQEYAQKVDLKLIVDTNYQLRDFLQRALTIEKNTDGLNLDNRRCRMCYAWRLHQTAIYAKENNFDAFSSFFYEDFRPGFAEGTQTSIDLELYRQPYCGCIFSEEERYSNSFKKKRKKKLKALFNEQNNQ